MDEDFIDRLTTMLLHIDVWLLAEPALLGTLTTLTVFRTYMRTIRSKGRARMIWCVLIAVVIGLGLWAMNFSAILALTPRPNVSYDPFVAVGSLVVCIILAAGIAPVALQKGKWKPSLFGGFYIAVSGLAAALQAIVFASWNTAPVFIWHLPVLLLAVFLAAGFATLGLKLSRSSRNWWERTASAVLLTATIMTQHVLAVFGLEVSSQAMPQAALDGMSHQQMTVTVTVITVLLAGVAFGLAALDHWTKGIARQRMRELADAALESLVLCEDGMIVDANAAFLSLVGFERSELRNCAFTDFVRSDHRAQLPDAAGQARAVDLVSRDGTLIPTETTMRRFVSGGRGRAAFAVRDLRQRKEAEQRIQHLAYHDNLTGLPNRILFRQRLNEGLAQARQTQEIVAILCLDLDHFKRVNDTLGHPAGDVLLRAVADRIRGCVRDVDTVARLGGDEFAVVLVSNLDLDEVRALAGRLIQRVSAPYDIEGHRVMIGTSVGIAVAPTDGAEPDSLLRSADTALYASKAKGRGNQCFFRPEMNARLQERRALEVDLLSAMENGEFQLAFQPLFDIKSRTISGCEALLRWHHPERGLVPPDEFIPLAEEIGLIVRLGGWVLQKACAEAASWPGDITLAVNLSSLQFMDDNLVKMVASALSASGLPGRRLELEITESVLLGENEANLAILHELRDLGVRISMDDFGTGYSSLSYLRSFPFDKLKIDRSFVTNLAESGECLAIVRAIVGLGHGLGITTVAEGVETEKQFQLLQTEGCSEVQGYLLGRPQPADSLRDLFAVPRPSPYSLDPPAKMMMAS